MPAIDLIHAAEKTGRGANEFCAGHIQLGQSFAQEICRFFGVSLGAGVTFGAEDDPHQAPEWWIPQLATITNFLSIETVKVVFGGGQNRIMVGLVGLQDDAPT